MKYELLENDTITKRSRGDRLEQDRLKAFNLAIIGLGYSRMEINEDGSLSEINK